MLVAHDHKKNHAHYHGFALLEVLLAIGLLSTLVASVVYIVQVNTDHNTVQRMGMEVNDLFAASLSYRQDHSSIWPGSIKKLETDGYIDSGMKVAPYEITSQGGDPVLILTIKTSNKLIQKGLLTLLPFSIPTPKTSNRITTRLVPFNSTAKSIQMDVVHPEGAVQFPPCPTNYSPHIYLAPASFDNQGKPIGTLQLQATKDTSKPQWIVHLFYTKAGSPTLDQVTAQDKDRRDANFILTFTTCETP